jgi:hypothetical protein
MQDGLVALQKEIQRACTLPAHCLPFLQPGRVVYIQHAGSDFGIGIIMNFTRNEALERAAAAAGESSVACNVFGCTPFRSNHMSSCIPSSV